MSDMSQIVANLNPTFGQSSASLRGGQSQTALQNAYSSGVSSGITGQLSILGNFQPPPPETYNQIFINGWRPS